MYGFNAVKVWAPLRSPIHTLVFALSSVSPFHFSSSCLLSHLFHRLPCPSESKGLRRTSVFFLFRWNQSATNNSAGRTHTLSHIKTLVSKISTVLHEIIDVQQWSNYFNCVDRIFSADLRASEEQNKTIPQTVFVVWLLTDCRLEESFTPHLQCLSPNRKYDPFNIIRLTI